MKGSVLNLARFPVFHLAGLAFLALLIRVLAIILFRFDGLYGQDPYAYYDYAQELAQALTAGQQPPPFFWPLGYPLLVVFGNLFTGWRPLAGQLPSIVAGAAITPLVFLLVLEIKPRARAGALAAGLLAATAGQLTLSSISVMADTTALAWGTLSAWSMLRYLRRLTPAWLALAAFSLGWAVITRWVYGLLVVPWAVAALLAWRASGWRWSRRFRNMGLAVTVGAIPLVVQFMASLGQPGAFTGDLQVYSWSPANFWLRTVTNPDGTFHYRWPATIFYARPLLHPSYLFPLLIPLWLLGLAFFWRQRRQAVAQATLVLGWVAIMYLFLAGVPWQNWRFPLSFFPPLLVLTGLGFQDGWEKSGQKRFLGIRGRTLLSGCLALALLGSLAWGVRDIRNFSNWSSELIAAARWTEAQLPSEATVITFGLTLTLEHRTNLAVEEIYILTPDDLLRLVDGNRELFLLLDLDNVTSQWADLSPANNLEWLDQHTKLVEIGERPPYTLFRVEPLTAAP